MERKSNKNEALEALDFIINVLKEHEKDLDRLISQLGIITESLGETGEITGKIENIEDRISTLQGEITNLVNHLAVPKDSTPSYTSGKPVNVKCRRWEDFKNLAAGAETVSYLFKASENTFQADALKNGKIVSYTGDFPPNTNLLKLWISQELNVDECSVFEGVLNIS
ncbi:MAG: hypothetical protein NWF06_10520 [Candidatus Bathyarchaeota archaeon]|nr:hypothetical protein [Candidatus Bathyarchaeum sp.]